MSRRIKQNRLTRIIYRLEVWIITATLLVCSVSESQRSNAARAPKTYQITVNADGTFTPQVVKIRDGDSVEWVLNSRTNAIIPTAAKPSPGVCPTPRAYDPTDPNEFTGPLPLAPSGIFTLGPLERGLKVEQGGCSFGPPRAIVGNNYLCATGEPFATMDSTYQDPSATGVFIRLLWNQVHLAPGTDDASFDFTVMDREIDKAVKNSKLYSLGFKAGSDGTPDWIFSSNRDGSQRSNGGGGVPRLRLQDSGSDDDVEGCGVRMDLGNPTNEMYQKHYFDLLTKAASHIRARADWYRALAYIKPSGANLFSHENRLPKRCKDGCICNTQVLAEDGYTPTGLYEFYQKQFALLAAQFPGKAMSYALIQEGFPLVNETGGYEQSNGRSSNGLPLPRNIEQTVTILANGQALHGEFFTVQHNGLGNKPPTSTCPNENMHPAQPPFESAGSGCPNRFVLEAGSDAQQITGFQTNNAEKVNSPEDINSTFENALVNSDASFIEIYEERFWEGQNRNQGVLVPGGKTIGEWAEIFHARRRDSFPAIADPFPKIHRHTFHRTVKKGNQFFYYYDPSNCGAGKATFGTIIIKQ
jgi:hypothetical protein